MTGSDDDGTLGLDTTDPGALDVATVAGFEALLEPNSVAVVGASPDNWYAAQLVDNLLEYGFDGSLHLVNPSRETAWERPCYDDLAALPDIPDLVVVCVPRSVAVDVVRSAAERGVPAALVISAGFAEADDEGEALQSELVDIADAHDIRIVGPNCIGVANALEGTVLTSTCSRSPEPGSIGLVSQSGALAFTTFFERAADEDVHFSHIVSTGNEAATSLTDVVAYLGAQDAVDVICTYVEGIDDAERFVGVADDVVRNGTPVLAIKVGQSSVAEAAMLSHTGSVTGADDVWEGAFAQAGVERVSDIPDLVGRASAHTAFDPPSSDRVCIASTSGGLASLLADMAVERDLTVPPIDGETEPRLLEMDELLTFGELSNPADIRGYGADVLPEIAEVLFADDDFDAYVFAVGLPATDERAETIADDLLVVAEMAADPVLFLWTGRKAPEEPTQTQPYERVRRETPLYYDPGRCLDALASLVRAGETRARALERPSRATLLEDLEDIEESTETESLPSDDVLSWKRTAELLEAYDIDVHPTALATDAEAAVDAAEEFGFPVVLKVDSPDVPHRTDADAVRTDLGDADAVREAYEQIVRNAREYVPDARINGVLIQPQAQAGVEALVGVIQDSAFGPVVTVATGGTAAELYDDAAVRVPPLSRQDALEAIDATTLGVRLAGHRDGRSRDVNALAEVLENVGRLCTAVDAVSELDLNPVLVHEDGVSIIDALVRTGS